MITISLCMIVKNEEDVLARCLDSIKDIVDEIIIVDTGSTDKTKEIANKYTEHVHDFEWIDDFSAARNFAFSLATGDYQMWLDADDVVPEASQKAILELKETLDLAVDIVTMKYNTHFDEQGKAILTSTRERLIKREKNYQWIDPIHECIPLIGNVHATDIEIDHKKTKPATPRRNIKIYEKMLQQGKELTPRQTYYYARELMDHGHYEESAHYFEKFLEGGAGWVEDNIATCFNLSRIYTFIKKEDKVLPILSKSFEYGTPRAEICCQLGYYFKNKKQYQVAIYWFEAAHQLVKQHNGFILNDYWDYIPYMELCDCYWRIGDYKKSKHFHQKAKKIKPTDPAVLHNEKFFETN